MQRLVSIGSISPEGSVTLSQRAYDVCSGMAASGVLCLLESREDSENVPYVVLSNTDLTEGRGASIPIGLSTSFSCAERLAEGRGVQGGPAAVVRAKTLFVDGVLYVAGCHVTSERPTKEDLDRDRKVSAKQVAMVKALSLGLTQEDLQALGVSK